MTATIQLGRHWYDCPTCWHNFIYHCKAISDTAEGDSVTDELIAQELMPYKAKAHLYGAHYMEFNTEQDKLHFLLRWE